MAVAESDARAQESVEDILRHIQASPENRDIALAMCLWHLKRLSAIGDALEAALPQIGALSGSGILGKILGGR